MKTILQIMLLLSGCCSFAQETVNSKLYNEVVALDKAVFDAFNNCDIEQFKSYFTDDVEFYHDKGGVTSTSDKLATSVRENICGNPGLKIRREVVPGTLAVYAMDNYGAILTGEHYFYQISEGLKTRTGKAKFTHLCRFTANQWKIHLVLSYDHQGIE